MERIPVILGPNAFHSRLVGKCVTEDISEYRPAAEGRI